MSMVPSFRLDGKVVLVTGASKGLGRAMALGFAESGADVVVSSRRVDACEKVAAEIREIGRRAEAIACHVGVWSDCDALIASTIARMGRLDVLVNNAGIAPVPPSLSGVTEELFDKTIAVNLKGPLRLMGLAGDVIPVGGSIINIGSKASTRPTPHTVVYAAAKAGLNTITRTTAREFGPKGIRVNTIVCGPFQTDSSGIPNAEAERQLVAALPLGRIATPDEIVGTALFLASPASAYMTGALLDLDGGGW
jgi:NAD(P)-dependent dehydrogenase (short-subunit alcohol dehydrogenase family)